MHVRVDPCLTLMEKVLRMQDKGIGKEWGVKSIKSRRDDGHGNIEFLVEWDGNWADTWEPPENLKNAADRIHTFLNPASGSHARNRNKRKAIE